MNWRRMVFVCFTVLLSASSLPAQEKAFLGKTAREWSSQLTNADAKQRRNGAFALGKMGRHAVPVLAAMMTAYRSEKDPKVKDALVFALGEICRGAEGGVVDGDLESLFITAASAPEPYVRRSAAFALGCMASKSNRTRTALEGALKDREAIVRQNAASALVQFGPDAPPMLKTALADADALVKRDAATALLYLGGSNDEKFNEQVHAKLREVIPDLLPLCREPHTEVQRAALNVLVRIVTSEDKAAIPSLLVAMEGRDIENRRNAALALSNIGGEETAKAVPILLDAIKNGEGDVRRQSVLAIRNIGPKAASALPELVRLLREDPDPKMREHAALALGGIGAPAEAAIPILVHKLKDVSEATQVRVECAMALSRIGAVPGAVAVVPDLLAVLGNTQHDGKVRERTIWALRVHGEKLAGMTGTRDVFTRTIKEPRDENNRMLRYDSAYMLGMVWQKDVPEEALGVLAEYLNDTNIQIFVGVSTDVSGAGDEVKAGKASVKVSTRGDGRTLAADALQRIGPGRYANRADIMKQLRVLATANGTYEPLRKKAAALLDAAK